MFYRLLFPLIMTMTILPCACSSSTDIQNEQAAVDISIMIGLPIIIKATNDCKWWKDASLFLQTQILPVVSTAKSIDPILEKWINSIDQTKPEAKSLFLTLQAVFANLAPGRLETLLKNVIGIINESCTGIKYGRIIKKSVY